MNIYLSYLHVCCITVFHHPPFCISTMIPISKRFNKDLSKYQSYGGFGLSSLFSKIFDYGLVSCEYDALKSDVLHFAYKSDMSTIQCDSVVTETTIYRMNVIYIYIYTSIQLKKYMEFKCEGRRPVGRPRTWLEICQNLRSTEMMFMTERNRKRML